MASNVAHDALVEQFVAQGEGATGRAAADLVEQATSAPGLFAFGELLDLEGIRSLEHDPALAGHLALLRVFAHGTLPEYRAAVASGAALPPLSPAQELKLKKLTVATMAERAQTLRYDDLMAALEVPTVRELEDLLINECIGPGLTRGKLDQRRACFEVHHAIGRDLRPGQLPELIATLDAWRQNAERALRDVEAKVRWANDAQANASRRKGEVDAEVAATIRAIKAEVEEAGRSAAAAATATEEEGMDFADNDAARSGIGSKRRR